MRPPLSIFTAAFKRGTGVEIPFRSLLAQTDADWEWVVVDDSRTPDGETLDHLHRLAAAPEAEGRVHVYSTSSGGSIGAAKAAATERCRGEILLELDHDDELLPDAVASVRAAFADHPDVDFVYSDFVDRREGLTSGGGAIYGPDWGFGFGAYATEMIGDRRTPVVMAPAITWETSRHIVAAPNHLRAWRAGFYRRIGGHDPSLAVGDDFELLVRTFLSGAMARIPRPLYVQYHDGDRMSASRRRNDEIQRVVAEVASRHEHEIDERCLELGAIPAGPEPLTSWEPLRSMARWVDPGSERPAEMPLVSVVIPTYQRPDLLTKALDSALQQSYSQIEVLVIGDGCPDVDGVIAGVADTRVRHWNLERNHGVEDNGAAARNHALKTMARGSLVAYLDDDNIWREDHIESLVAQFRAEPGLSFGFSSYTALGEAIICRRPERFQIDTSALMHRRSLLEEHGYWRPDEAAGGAHDWELVSRWSADLRWAATLEPTVSYRLSDSPRGRAILEAMREAAERASADARAPVAPF